MLFGSAVIGGGGVTLDPISTSGWPGGVTIAAPATDAATGAATLSWSVGGARLISLTPPAGSWLSTTIEYSINGGAWTTYIGPFSLNSGGTLNWKFYASLAGSGSGNASAEDSTRGAAIATFPVSVSGY